MPSIRDVFSRWSGCARTKLLAGLAAILVLAGSEVCQADLSRQQLDKAFSEQLSALAAKCDELGLKDEATATRDWIVPRSVGREYLFLPDAVQPKPSSARISQQWYERLQSLRAAQADGLFSLAGAALAAHEPTTAYQLLYEVLRENPEHAEARRVLGYTKNIRGLWLQYAGTPSAAPGGLDHPKLGWRRRTYWRLETPHYNILTNHSPKAAVDLGKRLEDLYALWQQIYFTYWSNEEALAARLAGGNEPLARARPKMKVVLFRNRAEYVSQLSPAQPQIAMTLGIYMDEQQTVYFYAGDESIYPTWYHEAAHQLFQESLPGLVSPGKERNFWLVEGAAMYLESLAEHDGFWTVGGWDADRLQFARYRALGGDFALPLAQLAKIGRDDLQKSPDIRKLYAHAAGLVHFLMDGEHGKYRPALVGCLKAVYEGRDAADTLAKLTGVELPELDREYLEYLNITDADLAGIVSPQRLRNLSLGRTAVTDAGLATLAGCTNLVWLDLSRAHVGDGGFANLKDATHLQQLFLEGTKITDASLPAIGKLTELEELDLSGLAITDDGLAALAGLKRLKTLYLTNSPISDASLAHLKGLKQLETVELSGTRVSPAGLKQLHAALPKLAKSAAE
jgi:hypothetical protein